MEERKYGSIAPIKDKIVESSVWWFGLVRRRPIEATCKKNLSYQMTGIICRGWAKPIKGFNETIKTDLDLNDFSTDLLNTIAKFNPCNLPYLVGNDFLFLHSFI